MTTEQLKKAKEIEKKTNALKEIKEHLNFFPHDKNFLTNFSFEITGRAAKENVYFDVESHIGKIYKGKVTSLLHDIKKTVELEIQVLEKELEDL